MAKKLTAKSIRQGQTVYIIGMVGSSSGGNIVSKYSITTNSRKKFAVGVIKSRAAGSVFVFYSHRKAIRKAKELNRMMGAM